MMFSNLCRFHTQEEITIEIDDKHIWRILAKDWQQLHLCEQA